MESCTSSNSKACSFTFQVDELEICKTVPRLQTAQEIINSLLGDVKIEDFSYKTDTESKFISDRLSGFLQAVHIAYAKHYPLQLSVSDFIILIGQGLSKHINNNSEKLRKLFVNHEGKVPLLIQRDEFVLGEQNDWSTVFGEFCEKIREKIKMDVYDVVVDDTSVATPVSTIVSQITLMDCMKQYFKYIIGSACGIPQITLEGTPEDWEKLRQKVRKLVEMNKGDCLKLDWWLKRLIPVIEKICDTGSKKEVDKEFWSGIYKYSSGYMTFHINGWITVFFPYLLTGKNKFGSISTRELPNQYCEVPFTWKYHGTNIPMKVYGGFFTASFSEKSLTVKPTHFWGVIHQKNSGQNNCGNCSLI